MNRQEVARGFAWNVLFGFVNKALFPLIGIVIARELGPDQLGIYVTIAAVLSVTEIFRDAGLGVTYIADKDAEEQEGIFVSLALVFGLIMGAALFLARGWLESVFRMPGLAWGLAMASIAVAMNGLATIPANKLQKQARFREAGFADTSATLLSYGVALPLVFTGYGFVGLVWQLLSRAILSLGFHLYLARIKPPSWNAENGKRILRLSVAAMLNNLAYTVYTLCDTALIAYLFGKKGAGLYGVAYNVAVKPLDFITFPLGRTLLVAFSQSSEDRARLAHIFCRSMAAVLLVSVPLYGFFVIFAEPIIVGLYSDSYDGAVAPFAMLSAYLFCRSFGNLAGNAVFALGRPSFNVFSWIPGYLICGIGLWINRESLTLVSATAWISGGAIAVYLVNTSFAFGLLKPARKDYEKISRSAVTGLASLAFMACAWLLPIGLWWRFGLGLSIGTLCQLLMVGISYGGSWSACLSKGGLKRVWSSL